MPDDDLLPLLRARLAGLYSPLLAGRRGERSGVQAFLDGALTVRGDLALALQRRRRSSSSTGCRRPTRRCCR